MRFHRLPGIFIFTFVTNLMLWATPASASFIGDNINGCLSTTSPGFSCTDSTTNFFLSGSGSTATISAGVEFTRVIDPGGSSERKFTADFADDFLTLSVDGTNSTTTSGSNATNQWLFTGLDFFGAGSGGIANISQQPGGTLPVLITSFTTDSILIVVDQIPFSALNGNVFTTGFQVTPVPIPASLPLLLGGLLGLLGVIRPKQSG